jgi:hemerythrin HHE cation binding domain-containing protein
MKEWRPMDESAETVDLIMVVQRDHREIEGLLDAVERADDGARPALFRDVVRKLESHEAAEADIVHALMRDLGAADIADDLLEEEKFAKQSLARLDASSPDFPREFKSFKEDVLTHARHEEREEHPSIRARASHDVLVRMGERFEAASDVRTSTADRSS